MPKLIVINFPFNYLIYLISYQTCFFTWTGGSDRNFFGSDRNRTDLFTLLGLVMEDLPVLDFADSGGHYGNGQASGSGAGNAANQQALLAAVAVASRDGGESGSGPTDAANDAGPLAASLPASHRRGKAA